MVRNPVVADESVSLILIVPSQGETPQIVEGWSPVAEFLSVKQERAKLPPAPSRFGSLGASLGRIFPVLPTGMTPLSTGEHVVNSEVFS